MRTVRKVSARYAVLLRDWLCTQGIDADTLLRTAGLGDARLQRRDAMLEPAEMEAFVAAGRLLSGRSDLGFELGRLIKMTSHDLLGYGMLSCRNIDEVLRLVARHYHLMTETFTLRYQRFGNGNGEAIYTPAMPMPPEMLCFYLEALAVAHDNQLRLMVPEGSREPYDVHMSMPAPPHLARYLALAPARFHFDGNALPAVRVVMSASTLDYPLPFADDHVVKEVDRRCSELAPRPGSARLDWVAYLRMMFLQAEGEPPTLESIARNHRVSARTIDRHLRRQNMSFRELLHEARIERACSLLGDPTLTVAKVAQRLGFSDAANFSRAFRRALGTPPSEYRQQAQPSKEAVD
ncbi:AraC family transcriptional regulator ligand-binding domain-containing protein [Luteibacter sp. Lutesp34]|uniref:AraC family transcriptional regulator n=1 Tax=Luteibacter sp. Lutesp34 TaxID=3243030 RepID=UPI0039B5331B